MCIYLNEKMHFCYVVKIIQGAGTKNKNAIFEDLVLKSRNAGDMGFVILEDTDRSFK